MPKPQTDDFAGLEGEGVTRKKIKRLEDAIGDWDDAKEKRMKLTEKEVETKVRVVEIMAAEGLRSYQYTDDRKVVLKDMLKVEKIKSNGAGDDE